MKKLRGLLIDVENSRFGKVQIPATLDEYYNLLDCDTIDIVTRKIAGKKYEIICDDNALLKSGVKPSAIDLNESPMLFGNIFIVKGVDKDGNLTSLSLKEIEELKKYVVLAEMVNVPSMFPIITQMGY